MDIKIKTWLYDILQSIDEIDSFYENRQKIFAEYLNDLKTRRAVERNLEIIGEAVSRILKKDDSFYLENSRKIIGTRNRIIHGYDSISNEMIWSIVINYLPKLRSEVEKHLNK
jgi:uncharacterized protein with HEPN domain